MAHGLRSFNPVSQLHSFRPARAEHSREQAVPRLGRQQTAREGGTMDKVSPSGMC